MISGHSLGGALATLAAYDVQAVGKSHDCPDKVTCMTFGAPRTGNHSFARDLEEMVPDTWHVINGESSAHIALVCGILIRASYLLFHAQSVLGTKSPRICAFSDYDHCQTCST